MNAVLKNPHFVMSGSMWSIRKPFEPFFDRAIFMTAPAEIRAERIRSRSLKRWGDRVLPGGDMYETTEGYKDYSAFAKCYDNDIVVYSKSCSGFARIFFSDNKIPMHFYGAWGFLAMRKPK